jgi:hypothetical protein
MKEVEPTPPQNPNEPSEGSEVLMRTTVPSLERNLRDGHSSLGQPTVNRTFLGSSQPRFPSMGLETEGKAQNILGYSAVGRLEDKAALPHWPVILETWTGVYGPGHQFTPGVGT